MTTTALSIVPTPDDNASDAYRQAHAMMLRRALEDGHDRH